MLNTTHTLRTPAAAVLAALALASLGLAACGESSGGSSPQTSAAAKNALEQLAKTKSIPSRTTTTSTASTPSGTTTAPQSGKSSSAPSGTTAAPRQAAGASRFKQALEAFTACLHRNGVPVAKGSGKGLLGLQGLDRSNPKFKSAALKCRGVLSAAFRGAH